MSRFERYGCLLAMALAAAVGLSGCGGGAAAATDESATAGSSAANRMNQYHLGHKATATEIAGWNIEILPDGTGLPPGQGSVAEGEQVYGTDCSSCHGAFGQSGDYQTLEEVKDKLNYAPTLYDYINRAMPFPNPKSLTPDQVYAVTAYVLNLLDIVPSDFVANKDTLPKVKMPNANRLKPYPGLMSVTGTPDTHNSNCMHDCVEAVKVTGKLPAGFVDKMYGNIDDNFRGLAVMNEKGQPVPTPPASASTSAAASGKQLIKQYGCVACHSVDHKVVGPAFRAVAAKYHGDDKAEAYLVKKIRNGGSGVWGPVPMPPQTGPSDAELKTIAEWVLAVPPGK